MKTEITVNFDNPAEKGLLLDKIRDLSGIHKIKIARFQKGRTNRQNSYYWPAFVVPFADWFRAQNIEFSGRVASNEDAHEVLKFKFLPPIEMVNKNSGQLTTMRGNTTTTLTTKEFNTFLERCACFLAEKCGIVVPEPSIYREPDDEPVPFAQAQKESRALSAVERY